MGVSIQRTFASFTLMFLAFVLFACPAAAQSRGSVTVNVSLVDPIPVGKLGTASLSAEPTAPEDGYEGATYSNLTWYWYATGTDGLSVDTSTSSIKPTLKATISSTGNHSIFVKAIATWDKSTGGTVSEAGEITFILPVVGVQKLQAMPSGTTYADVSGVLYVPLGETLNFNAVPTPTGAFPAGEPVWSGTSGSKISDSEISVTFSTVSTTATDYKTVTATCGDSCMTAEVIVYDLVGILTPDDNFDGRDKDYYGVGEIINLSFQITPTGIPASNVGGLEWSIASGGGYLSDAGNGTGTYECPDVAAVPILTLTIQEGPMQGQKLKLLNPIESVEPPGDNVLVLNQDADDLWHVENSCSIGFIGDCYCTTGKIVSLKRVEIQAGECNANAKGYYFQQMYNGKKYAAWSSWYGLLARVEGRGYQWDTYDVVDSPLEYEDICIPFDDGTLTCAFPCLYRVTGRANSGGTFATATKECISDANGKCTIRKSGSGDFSAVFGAETTTPELWP